MMKDALAGISLLLVFGIMVAAADTLYTGFRLETNPVAQSWTYMMTNIDPTPPVQIMSGMTEKALIVGSYFK